MLRQLKSLIGLHLKEFFREPGILFWAILFPVLMAWGLGLAFTKKSELIRSVALVEDEYVINDIPGFENFFDEADGATKTKVVGNETLGLTTYQFKSASWDEAITMLKRGQVSLIMKAEKDSVYYHLDPLNPEAQLSYLQLNTSAQAATSNTNEKISPLTYTGTRYIDFLVPGLVAFGVMMSCMWGISYSLIDKRMKKLLRRMVATPMHKSMFLAAQFIARMLLNFVESGILLTFTYFYFDIRLQGSWLALIILIIVGNLAFTGMAILVSSRTANTQIGNGLINMVVMPMMILSGIFFSYHNFPDWAINVIQKLPLTILADSIRSVFIEGAGLAQVTTGIFVLLGIGVATFLTGLKLYRWY